jgi:endonuclease/exonuclease/phosphatase family metal-dependent hydrolase
MTYNVLGGPVPPEWVPLIRREELLPMVRAPGVVAKVELADPDVVGLQEFATGSEPALWIEQHLNAYTWLHGPDNHALLARSSRFEVVGTGDRRLNTAGEEGSLLDRFVDWARLRERSSGRTVLVLNVHAHPFQTPDFARVRGLAIERLVAVLQELDPGLAEPLVLLGDFNAADREGRPVFRDHLTGLRAAGLVDAATVAAHDTSDVPGASSLHQLVAKVAGRPVAKVIRRSGRHIDYVWVPRGVRVSSWQVLSGPGVEWRRVRGVRVPTWTGIIPSDHSPVVADLRFR